MPVILQWVRDQDGGFVKEAVEIAGLDSPEPAESLSPRQFMWMLATTDLGDVWDAVESHLKGSGRPADRDLYAVLVANRHAGVFLLDDTLKLVSQLRPLIEKLVPGVDVSDGRIRELWRAAVEFA